MGEPNEIGSGMHNAYNNITGLHDINQSAIFRFIEPI